MKRAEPYLQARQAQVNWLSCLTHGIDGLVNVEEERVLHVGDDHTDGPALASGQAAGVEVGVVLQFFDSLGDSRARGILDDTGIVQDA
jgi:hypothetical protein